MELRQLRYFAEVADTEHLTRAAERLGIRPTSLSQQLIALEAELGATLFDRTPRGMAPTAAAHALLPYARRTLDAVAAGVRAVAATTGAARPWRIGVTPGAPAAVVAALHDAPAGTDARDLSTEEQLRELRRGELDAALVAEPVPLETLTARRVSDVALGVLLSAANPLAARTALDWSDLDGLDLLWFDRDLAPGYHDATLTAIRRAGWRPRRIRRGPPRRALFLAALRRGDVVALRPRWDAALDGTVWRELPAPPRLRHALVWDPAHPDAARLADLAAGLADEA
ncbi:LysR family transcriptional regulator [Nocardia sp. NPDC048505]|uniref:LysR family transcriptional regulator n=1 Tax=unclassified Nocardia TaxID=2637762 RepID=UPI003410F4D7